jgi:hypothetical protein
MFIFNAFAVSFLGSLPPGAISLSLVQKCHNSSWQKMLVWALAASILENFHLGLAFILHQNVFSSEALLEYTQPLSALLLIFLGWRNWNQMRSPNPHSVLNFKDFLLLNLLNVAALPFWLGILQWLQPGPTDGFLLILAATAGAFSCLFCYALLGSQILSQPWLSPTFFHRAISLCFWVLGVWQLIPFLSKISFFVL